MINFIMEYIKIYKLKITVYLIITFVLIGLSLIYPYIQSLFINGIVYSTKPLNYSGNLINNFSFTFKDGKIIDFTAEEGYDALKELLDTDEGSRYLGEVALVPYNSPISNSNILFYNTLFDENASCHLALGKAYPSCIKGGEEMNDEELINASSNISLTHVDFMVGSKDLNIIGVTHDGKEIQVFKDGNFAF